MQKIIQNPSEQVMKQINKELANYLPRCCAQCKHENDLEQICGLNKNLPTHTHNMLRRHPDCPLDKKGGKG